jgi:hypothetical protein
MRGFPPSQPVSCLPACETGWQAGYAGSWEETAKYALNLSGSMVYFFLYKKNIYKKKDKRDICMFHQPAECCVAEISYIYLL